MNINQVPLSEAVDGLREALTRSFNKKPEQGIVFNIQSVELELQVVAETSSKGELSGGWSLLGWNMGGKVEGADSHTGIHKVKMILNPSFIDEKGQPNKVDISSTDEDQR